MTVTVDDVKKLLPNYQNLNDDQIEGAIQIARGYLTGVNGDWAKHSEADSALLLSSASFTLKAHFPQSVSTFTAFDNQVADILNSMWSSSNMTKNKNKFMRVIGTREEQKRHTREYILSKGRYI
jgi:hypothetical protein